MARQTDQSAHNSRNRRDFIKTTSALAAAGALGSGLPIARGAHADGGDTLRIGLIGCGGRGTGAALNAIKADKNCKLVALADAFDDRLQGCLKTLQKTAGRMEMPEKVAVDPDHCFVGFDAAADLIGSGVDVVLLATPPHFRPMHLKAAIDAGKHVFCEKPVAVDAPGVRSVLATAEEAKKKDLSIVSGLCWRYDQGVCETMKRILDGAIGRITSIQETYLTGLLWHRGRKPEWTEMEYQMRNWYYFTWLSGDFNVEQHVHSLDKAAWAMHDEPPVRAWGLGGRLVRVGPENGDIYDHHAVIYEYPDGVHVHSYCRQMADCSNDVSDMFVGTKGTAYLYSKPRIEGENPWVYEGPSPGSKMYDKEHEELFAAIRAGKPLNNGVYMARSTMWAILGRMVDYTGQVIKWDDALNSKLDLSPARYAFDAPPPVLPGPDGNYPIPKPGTTKFI